MNQIFHIFRKDVCRFWPLISILLMLVIVHAALDVVDRPITTTEGRRIAMLTQTAKMILPPCMWLLIAVTVFQEALSDDREFWLTRPYSRWKLLIAKLFFFFVFINVPMFFSDCYILGIQGFPVGRSLPDLLLRQVPITLLFILPQFLIATVTSNVGQFVLAWIILILTLVLQFAGATFLRFGSGRAFDINFNGGLLIVFLASLFLAVLRWQYFNRETMKSRLAILAFALFTMPVLSKVSLPDSPKTQHKNNVHIEYDLTRRHTPDQNDPIPSPDVAVIRLPINVEGIPPQTLFRGTGNFSLEIGGKLWPESESKFFGTISRGNNGYWQEFRIPASTLNTLKEPVNLRSSFDFEIVTNIVKFTESMDQPAFVVPGVGHCFNTRDGANTYLSCKAGLGNIGETEIVTSKTQSPLRNGFVRAQRLLPVGLSPVTQVCFVVFYAARPRAKFEFIPHEPVMKFFRILDLPNVRLADFVVNP